MDILTYILYPPLPPPLPKMVFQEFSQKKLTMRSTHFYIIVFFIVKTHNIYQSIITPEEKRTDVTLAYFHESLSYSLCLHDRTMNYLQNKFQRSIATVKNQNKCKNNLWWKGSNLFFGLADVKRVKKSPLPKHYSQTSAKLTKILWLYLPFFCGLHK